MLVDLLACWALCLPTQQPGSRTPDDRAGMAGRPPQVMPAGTKARPPAAASNDPRCRSAPAMCCCRTDSNGQFRHDHFFPHHGFGWSGFFLPVEIHRGWTTTVDFFGPPIGFMPVLPLGYSGFVPFYPPPSAYYGRQPVPVFDPRAQPQPLDPGVPRGRAIDVPEQLVEQLAAPRRPTLADRAQAARLEGAGDRMFRAGQLGRAVERYRQALDRAPDNDEAKFKLGAALLAASQYDEAGQVLREALHRRPDWPHVPHDLRGLFPDDAAIRRVLEKLERESRRAAADPDVQFLRGYLLYFTGDREAAAAIFRNPPRAGPTEHFTIFAEAIERQRNGQ